MKALKLSLLSIIILFAFSINANNTTKVPNEFKISKTELLNKIKGGWAGQVIGCTYGGPTEFKWNGTMIGDHVPIPWDETRLLWYCGYRAGCQG